MATALEDEKVDIENSEDDIQDETNRAESPVSSLSLDVLAQVASDRLQTDTGKTTLKASLKNKGTKKAPKRALQSLDRLDLLQIKSLSNKLLVSLFSEMSSDELRRQYTLTCLLEPNTCKQTVTVYGNEMKAKMEMQQHLTQHLEMLIQKHKLDPESFIAETLPGRKKKFFAKKRWELKDKKKKKAGTSTSPYPPSYNAKYRRGRPPMFPQTLHDYADLGYEIDKVELEEGGKLSKDQLMQAGLGEHFQLKQEEATEELTDSRTAPEKPLTLFLHGEDAVKMKEVGDKAALENIFATEGDGSGYLQLQLIPRSETAMEKETFILDLLSKSQPYADHNYTSILGKKRGIESVQFEDSGDEGEETASSLLAKGQLYSLIPDKITKDDKPPITVKISGEPGKDPTMLHVPILKLPPIPILPKQDLAKDNEQQENEPTPEEQVLHALTRLAEKMTEQKKRNGEGSN